MFTAIASLLTLSLYLLSVNAHGYVQDVQIGSTHYTGYLPYQDPYMNPQPQRIIRKIPGNGPITDVKSIDMQCNGNTAGGSPGTSPAPLVAKVAAGSDVKLTWTTWPESHKGPALTYMARAPSDITKWNPGTSAVWFKVAEAGKTSAGWAATDVLYANNHVYTFKIPPKLKPGQYIIRHELIALHESFGYPGSQFYPSCIQVEVTGSGTALPTSGLVSFPGAYTQSSPGIVYNIYTNTSAYPIPGPAVWKGGN
ncbi:hypothetical protein NLI96_g1922 [Meripilus lineatus]|uniref:lytic cellulose monooxygenase (C4-dehydrogenating) n=1 Tax=Meripilus lineatus TaxID=2056292 RepID=A0AAD5YKF1_9APHY|nr:hypothetical protein NLI96_g1922 [Physisporinus lineatus]